jgi:hypothetical protein
MALAGAPHGDQHLRRDSTAWICASTAFSISAAGRWPISATGRQGRARVAPLVQVGNVVAVLQRPFFFLYEGIMRWPSGANSSPVSSAGCLAACSRGACLRRSMKACAAFHRLGCDDGFVLAFVPLAVVGDLAEVDAVAQHLEQVLLVDGAAPDVAVRPASATPWWCGLRSPIRAPTAPPIHARRSAGRCRAPAPPRAFVDDELALDDVVARAAGRRPSTCPWPCWPRSCRGCARR